MRKLLLSLMALAAVTVSCQKESTPTDYTGEGAIAVTIEVDAPELNISRAGEGGMNSGCGAIDNFNTAPYEWSKYDIRYMMEIFDVTRDSKNTDTPILDRMVRTLDSYRPTSFELRLIPNRTYKFVVWADFVLEGETADLNYNTTDLRNITLKSGAKAMDEAMDAYFVQQDVTIKNSLPQPLTLLRPFGKVRVIATDFDQLNIGSTPETVNVKFYNHPIYRSFNAINGKTSTTVEDVVYTYNISKEAPYSEGHDADASMQTLFSDYILAQQDATQEINFTLEVLEQGGLVIRKHDFNTQIPLERNKLTTIIGSLFTTNTEFEIDIDDNFSGEYSNDDPMPTPVTLTVDSHEVGYKYGGSFDIAFNFGSSKVQFSLFTGQTKSNGQTELTEGDYTLNTEQTPGSIYATESKFYGNNSNKGVDLTSASATITKVSESTYAIEAEFRHKDSTERYKFSYEFSL